MSSILPHMVWPEWVFRMQVWNVQHAAPLKYRTQKIAKNSSRHHRIILSGCIFASKAHIDNRKKNLLNSNISLTCPHNMVNFGLLMAEICWRVWGTPANFNGFLVLAALLHGTPIGRQPNFAALNRGRHLYSAGRPSCWALAHVSSFHKISQVTNYTLSQPLDNLSFRIQVHCLIAEFHACHKYAQFYDMTQSKCEM